MATNREARAVSVPLWVPGDWNAFFGLFTNVILNVLVLTGLVLGVVKLPDDIVFGRILPALGIALPLGNLYYAYLALRLSQREGRNDVTAMPYGPSVSHTFISMRPAFQMWEVPWIAFITLALVLVAWTASVRLPFGLPAGLVAIV